MIDLILLAAGPAHLDNQALLAPVHGKPLYRHAFEAARQTADAMLGLRVIVVTRPGVLDEAIREFGFNKVVVSEHQALSQAVIAGSKAARSGASRCFLQCDHPETVLYFKRTNFGPGHRTGRGPWPHGVCPLSAPPSSGLEGGRGRCRPVPGEGGPHLLLFPGGDTALPHEGVIFQIPAKISNKFYTKRLEKLWILCYNRGSFRGQEGGGFYGWSRIPGHPSGSSRSAFICSFPETIQAPCGPTQLTR